MLIEKRKYFSARNLVVYILIIAAMLVLVMAAVNAFSSSAEEEAIKVLDQAISRSLVTCFAIEGSYPSSIEYLEANYGLKIDHDRFLVDYRIFASNVMPDFTLIPK